MLGFHISGAKVSNQRRSEFVAFDTCTRMGTHAEGVGRGGKGEGRAHARWHPSKKEDAECARKVEGREVSGHGLMRRLARQALYNLYENICKEDFAIDDLSELTIQLLTGMLNKDEDERWTIDECLHWPWVLLTISVAKLPALNPYSFPCQGVCPTRSVNPPPLIKGIASHECWEEAMMFDCLGGLEFHNRTNTALCLWQDLCLRSGLIHSEWMGLKQETACVPENWRQI